MKTNDSLKTSQPLQVDHASRIRMGCSSDGGYIIKDHKDSSQTVLYSYEIQDDYSLDQHYHNQYRTDVRQYDFSIPPPLQRKGFSFSQQGISDAKPRHCNTFETHRTRNSDQNQRKNI